MASSPPNLRDEHADSAVAESAIGFALQEVAACWNQAHEAMSRGDLQSVTALLDQADQLLPSVGDGNDDSPEEARWRQRAATTYGLLQHAMQAGLDGIRTELGHARRGAKALQGYVKAAGSRDSNMLKSV